MAYSLVLFLFEKDDNWNNCHYQYVISLTISLFGAEEQKLYSGTWKQVLVSHSKLPLILEAREVVGNQEFLVHPPSHFFKKGFISLCLEKGEGREKERERDIDQLLLKRSPTGDQARKPGMCPDLESSRWPWDNAQPTAPCQSQLLFIKIFIYHPPIFNRPATYQNPALFWIRRICW